MSRPVFLLFTVLATACSGELYLRDGVTDGDTFYLAPQAFADDDPVLHSWVAYSLSLSACQLALGGENPARSTAFDCEFTARRLLLETWRERGSAADAYLVALAGVADAGYLAEYVALHFGRDHWTLPAGLDADGYRHYRREHLPGHRPQTRLVGSWNYARNVRAAH